MISPNFTKWMIPVLFISYSQEQMVPDIFDKVTSVGQLGMTVTNFGVLGNGWNKINGQVLPSCQYKQHTSIQRDQIEHFSYAGLWIGGKVNGIPRVSTAIVDGVFESGDEGFEFVSASGIDIRSSISSTSQDSMAQFYSPFAVSHQDFLTDFQDYGLNSNDNNNITNHTPLGIDVHLETYAWNFSFANAFVILNYTITNQSTEIIEDLYAGIWTDASVANMNYTSRYEPGGGFTWYDNLDGFDESIDESGFTRDIAYQFDGDGDNGWAESYIGVTMLGSSTPRPHIQSYYNQWVWTNSTNTDYPDYNMALDDDSRYEKLSSSVPKGTSDLFNSQGYPSKTNSWLFMLSAGPFGNQMDSDSTLMLLPGESCSIAFAVVCGLWNGSGSDSPERRSNLIVNADWAQKAYDGEDKNRNNILDNGEDLNNNGLLDRYILPEPPPIPNIAVDVGDQNVTVFWQNNAEHFVDPISREQDFEGYRIYGARKTKGEDLSEYSLLGEFDKADGLSSEIGYNSGFEFIMIQNESGEQDSILIDGNYYHYKFENSGVKNGWLNYFAVTAFDRGDPEANLGSLESSIYGNRIYVYPGVQPETEMAGWSPSVYPNPYRGQAKWDDFGSRERMIWFQGLPQKAEIRIFTLAGDPIDILHHDENYLGSNIKNIHSHQNPEFSGGEHAWDLITKHDQGIASGLYLFTVENLDSQSGGFGTIKEGKFLVIK
ncbi:MAG: hypothetical protein QF769_03530 [Candidatus Marinimicrobia bacterium]|nr:hypothetical protein [Candidatus Neomarinimicrobiota bacterium]